MPLLVVFCGTNKDNGCQGHTITCEVSSTFFLTSTIFSKCLPHDPILMSDSINLHGICCPLINVNEICWYLIFQIISVIDGWGISFEIALRWMSLDLAGYKSTLDQVMAWCRQVTSHYLSQCWPRSMSPYGVTRPQWVKENFFDVTIG